MTTMTANEGELAVFPCLSLKKIHTEKHIHNFICWPPAPCTMVLRFLDHSIFEDAYSAAVAQARIVDEKYEVGSNHVSILQILSEPNFKDLTYIIWRTSQLHNKSADRKALAYEKVKRLFIGLGYGDINRFRPMDSEDVFNKTRISHFMTDTTIFLIREKQIACARCNVVSIDKRYGALSFESDHVDENFRKEGEEKTKGFELGGGTYCSILNLLGETSKTQLTCPTCHFSITHTKDFSDIIKK